MATKEHVEAGALTPRRLRRAIEERSRLYTSDRDHLHAPSDVAADLAARALFFTVADTPKSSVAAAELDNRGLLAADLRVLDVGAGCGAMSWGLLERRDPSALELLALDRDGAALRILQATAKALGVRASVGTQDVSAPIPNGPYDLILVGTMLNELAEPAGVVERLVERLDDNGALVIIEPALREQSRALHRLRDWVLDRKLAHVFAPCVRRIGPCPALEDERDWCHEDRPIELPPLARQLSVETSLRRQGMKFSYLVLRKSEASLVDAVPRARVVSRVRKLKGKWEAFACSDSGRERMSLLKRDVTAGNRAFVELERGDVLVGAQGARLHKDSVVRRHRPARDDP